MIIVFYVPVELVLSLCIRRESCKFTEIIGYIFSCHSRRDAHTKTVQEQTSMDCSQCAEREQLTVLMSPVAAPQLVGRTPLIKSIINLGQNQTGSYTVCVCACVWNLHHSSSFMILLK